jgi:hypothetical protein
MPTLAPAAELVTGMRMTREEFLAAWEELPDLKRAELIDGEVWVASPVRIDHWQPEGLIGLWLGMFSLRTIGCQFGHNGTWEMLGSIPQPDVFLRIAPAYGGQSSDGKKFPIGAPELAVEICVTSRDYDFGPKLHLYRRAGVREYITLETFRNRIVWRALEEDRYREVAPDENGVYRSERFPGLWLDSKALIANDGAKLLATLEQGLATPEHAAFVEELAAGQRP